MLVPSALRAPAPVNQGVRQNTKMLDRNVVLGHICDIQSQEHHLARSHIIYDQCLQEMIDCLEAIQSSTNKNFVNRFLNKLQLKQTTFNEEQFIQDCCDLTLAGHFAEKFAKGFSYERKINGRKDVDFSFLLENITVNVEVKCPTPTGRNEAIELHFNDRMPDREKLIAPLLKSLSARGASVAVVGREDLKLKDFLISASTKFNQCAPKDTNILAICCDDEMHMQRYRNYLLRANPVMDELPFDLSAFSDVHYICLNNLGHRHRAIYSNDFKYPECPWRAKKSLNLADSKVKCNTCNPVRSADAKHSQTVPATSA
jgi:hypothetical protein